MLYIENDKYFRICDDCGNVREIKKDTYLINLKKDKHFCKSCSQRGEKNHRFNKDPWNKGLSKEVDERVRHYGEKGSIAKQGSIPWNKDKTYAELKSDDWAEEFKDKISKSKKGKPNLKRRYSTNMNKSFHFFREACRGLLYITWKRPILERDNFTCTMCGEHKNLEVHHLKPFRDILKETAIEMGLNLNEFKEWSSDILEKYREKVVSNHNLSDGVTLCKDCHKNVDMYRRRFYHD